MGCHGCANSQPADYGTVTVDNYIQNNGQSYHRFVVSAGSKIDRLLIQGEESMKVGATNIVSILGALDYSWTDTLLEHNIVKRVIGKLEIYFFT